MIAIGDLVHNTYVQTAVITWFGNTFLSAFINALEVPTKESSPKYRFFFRLVTGIVAGNPKRAWNSSVESSPNFKDALNIQQRAAGQPETRVHPPAPPPNNGGK